MADTVFSHAYNNLELTLGESIDDAVTEFDIGTGEGASLDAAQMPVIVSVGNPTTPAIYEFILIQTFTGDHVDTCIRGYLSAGLGATAWPTGQELQNRNAAPYSNQFLDALENGWEASGCDPILGDIRALGVFRAGSGNVQVTTTGGQVQWTAINSGGAASGQVMQWNGSAWLPVPSGSGDASGPAGATDNAVARFNTATGKLIQNSGVLIDDSDNVTIPGTITVGSGSEVITTAAGLLVPAKLDQDGAVDNQALVWNGADWGPDTVGAPNGTADDNAVPRFDGVTGRLTQNSGVLIDDSNNMTIPGIITAGSGSEVLTNAAGELLLAALEQDGAAGNEVMTWNNSTLKWEPTALTVIGVLGPVTSTVNAIATWADGAGDALLSAAPTIDSGTGDMTLGGTALIAGASTFDLLDTVTTTLNFARAATNIQMGAATGSTTVRNDLIANKDLVIGGGDITSTVATVNIFNDTVTDLTIGNVATVFRLGSADTGIFLAPGFQLSVGSDVNDVFIGVGAGVTTDIIIGTSPSTTTIQGTFTATGTVINMADLPTSDPSVSGQLWVDTTAGRVIKQSA